MSEAMRSRPSGPSLSSTTSVSPSVYAEVPHGSAASGMSESGLRAQMQGLDSNLEALCEHVQTEGWNSRAFSDIVVQAMGSTFYLHRLLLSRSSYFRNMLQGPWKEATAPVVKLQIDDENVNVDAVTAALGYLYGHLPKLDDGNAFRVLAAASFLDLQDLCALCTDFIISDLWTENFLSYQAFAESQDYGVHGERIRKACWGYLCRGGAVELREVLPKLSSQTLRALLTSDELWVPSEEKRFELALSVLLARGVVTEIDSCSVSDEASDAGTSESCSLVVNPEIASTETRTQGVMCCSSYETEVAEAVRSIVLDMVDSLALKEQSVSGSQLEIILGASEQHIRDTSRFIDHQSSEAIISSTRLAGQTCGSPSWGGRVVGKRVMKAYPSSGFDELETFMNIFEGGRVYYCHMLFEDLLEARARLEELGFPCKAVADGLWLHTLLRQQVLTVAADTCRNCSFPLASCGCRQQLYPAHGRIATFREDQDKSQTTTENQSTSSNSNSQPRVHVRGGIDGLAGIGRGTAGAAWPPPRFMFARVAGPGMRATQQQQQVGNEQGDSRFEPSGDLATSTDGLNVVVGLSQGISSGSPLQSDQSYRHEDSIIKPVAESSNANSSQFHQIEGDNSQGSQISLDLHTPLRSFPPFRFGVEFEDVQRLTDGQSKHSPEVFYAGSLWKVSVQAFNDEDPRCRRTLGLFLHRRKADDSGPFRKVSLYIDSREKVTARYQLICPAKRGVMILGSLTQAGTLLPKAPKGWGWRTAFLFDELVELLQGNSLRVVAVVQVV